MDSLYKKASKTFFINVAGLVIAFLFQFILGRVLQPEIYGQYTMFTIYVNIFTIFTVMGMDRNLIKQAAKVDKNKKISYIKFSLKISFILFIIVSSFAIYFWSNLQIYRQYTAIFIGALLIKSFALIIDGYLQGLGKIVRVTMINTLLNNTLKILLFLLFVVLIKDGGLSSILSFTISETICLICRINLFDNKINFIINKNRFFTKE